MDAKPFIDLDVAHRFSSGHRKQVEESDLCGCFYCRSTFSPSVIEEWIDEDESEVGQTALCPRCSIDSVIVSKAGFPLTPEFLEAMNKYWF
jgi:hypothetical protein